MALTTPAAMAAHSTATAATVSVSTGTSQAAHSNSTEPPGGTCTEQFEFGPVATYTCNTDWAKITWGDGRMEYAVLGTNGVVYHEWQLSSGDKQGSGWYPFGSSNNVYNGVWAYLDGHSNPVIFVAGGDRNTWCNGWNGSAWSNWYEC